MSGGSLDYAYHQIEELANVIERQAKRPIHKAFVDHLRLVANAAHDLEWEWSGDYGEKQADKSIEKIINPILILESVKIEAERVLLELKSALDKAGYR